jgi:predicted DNA-binding ribbon-helix-helix protein
MMANLSAARLGFRILCCFCNARGIFQNCHSLTRFCCSHVACLQQHAGGMMKSLILKRSVVLAGHKTSVSLEDAFWRSLKEIAAYQHVTLSALLVSIDSGRDHGNLSSAIRLFVLNFYRDQLEVREQSERVQAIRPPSSNGRYEPLTSVAQAQHKAAQLV